MTDGLERAREQRNWLERLAAKIPGFRGYFEHELRREVDKIQRDWIADQIDRGRSGVQEKIREWSRRGQLQNLDLASSMEKMLDRLANRVRHADYGNSGFFDAIKIREEELDALYRFDLELSVLVEDLAARIEALPGEAEETTIRAALDTVLQADRLFDERAYRIENVTQKGIR